VEIFLMQHATSARLYVVEGFETAPAFLAVFLGCLANAADGLDRRCKSNFLYYNVAIVIYAMMWMRCPRKKFKHASDGIDYRYAARRKCA
jgi:hypothetical protein